MNPVSTEKFAGGSGLSGNLYSELDLIGYFRIDPHFAFWYGVAYLHADTSGAIAKARGHLLEADALTGFLMLTSTY